MDYVAEIEKLIPEQVKRLEYLRPFEQATKLVCPDQTKEIRLLLDLVMGLAQLKGDIVGGKLPASVRKLLRESTAEIKEISV